MNNVIVTKQRHVGHLRTFTGLLMRIFSAHVTHVTFVVFTHWLIIPGQFLYDTVSLTHQNAFFFFSQSTQNHDKHEHIEHIMGYIMLRHRKLVVVLMRYIDITLLDAW